MRIRPIVVTLGLVAMHATSLTASPERLDTRKMITEIDRALEKAEWSKAEEKIERIFTFYDRWHSIPGVSVGPLRFKKGWCELQQKKWKEAQKSFEACYKKYPDRKKNPYHLLALRAWADAEVGEGDSAAAARLYRKYIEETSKADWDNPFKMENQ